MTPPLTAKSAGLISCHICRHLTPIAQAAETKVCSMCGEHLHSRKNNSITRCWALVLTAYILYIPANLLPMTKAATLGRMQEDTIMSGVIYFMTTGMWPIALVIFIASVFVPLVKLFILTGLLISVQCRSSWRPSERTRLYRMTELIGRWSMVDIYVLTILVALVKLGAIAHIDAGPAGLFFALLVIVTIVAAQAFDPRLIWDYMENEND